MEILQVPGNVGASQAVCSGARGHGGDSVPPSAALQKSSAAQHVHAWLVQLISLMYRNKAGPGNAVYLLCLSCVLKT